MVKRKQYLAILRDIRNSFFFLCDLSRLLQCLLSAYFFNAGDFAQYLPSLTYCISINIAGEIKLRSNLICYRI